jgi:thioesterase domain-containing protein
VAFEVARQLVANRQEVALLALIEVPTPGYPKIVRQWKKYFRYSANLLSALVRGESHVGWAGIRSHLGFWNKLFARKRQAVTRRVLISVGMHAVIEPVERIDLRNERAGRAYTPGALRCNVVHFLAADEPHSTVILDDPRLGWSDVVEHRFAVRRVPGRASAILKPRTWVNSLRNSARCSIVRTKQRGVVRLFEVPTRKDSVCGPRRPLGAPTP